MKKILFGLLLLTPLLTEAQLVKTLKKTISLNMPGKVYVSYRTGEDSMSGTRGGAVAWHPLQKKYYAAFAGNQSYPLAVFDASGKLLSDDKLTCIADLRGLWYNPKLKSICGNGYYDIGWFSYRLSKSGIPEDIDVFAAGANQPDAQCIGTFNSKLNRVCFIYGQEIYMYNEGAMQLEDSIIRLYPGVSKKENIDKDDDGYTLGDDYNSNVLIYTGTPRAEYGLLNANQKQVELYNEKTGLLTQILKLPADLPTWYAFNFSYANGIYWAFDQDTRTWTGYK
ncbi:MAG: hypothetical protein IPL84_05860 [Chitinophagaceae bacterium]|nr:hypothetical protein [Chitinophagaceae bacterium]